MMARKQNYQEVFFSSRKTTKKKYRCISKPLNVKVIRTGTINQKKKNDNFSVKWLRTGANNMISDKEVKNNNQMSDTEARTT